MKFFLSGRFQGVLLNGQTSDWATIQAGVPHDSILGPLFFLIYINDPTDNLNSNVKLFADDTSLFSEICDSLETANALSKEFTNGLNNGKWVLTKIQLNKLRNYFFLENHILRSFLIYTLIVL